MKICAPDYYERFHCIAELCSHTCCAGWEIDIDEETAMNYQAMPGTTGDELRRNITRDEDGTWHFILNEKEICPMLRKDGLCKLITSCGEGALCQICTDHPRFRNFFDDRTEIGLGLCCEAAARLILSWEPPAQIYPIGEDDLDAEENANEQLLLKMRAALIFQAQNRTRPIADRVRSLLASVNAPDADVLRMLPLLKELERLSPVWGELLDALGDTEDHGEPDPAFDMPLEQLIVCLLYRHMPGAVQDGLFAERVSLCVLLWRLVVAIWLQGDQTMDRLVEITRMMSSEIEYSDENMNALLDALTDPDA